jgi:hypothetical protein
LAWSCSKGTAAPCGRRTTGRSGAASGKKEWRSRTAAPYCCVVLGSRGEVDAGLRIPVRRLWAVQADAVDVAIRAAGRLPAVPSQRTARHAHRPVLLDGLAADAARSGRQRAKRRQPAVGGRCPRRELLVLHEQLLAGQQARRRESFLVRRQWMIAHRQGARCPPASATGERADGSWRQPRDNRGSGNSNRRCPTAPSCTACSS